MVIYTFCLSIKSLCQSVTGQCCCDVGSYFTVWLSTGQDNAHWPKCMFVPPIVNMMTGWRMTG